MVDPPGSIEGAHRLGQQRLNLCFQPGVVAGEESLLNRDAHGRGDPVFHPLQNLRLAEAVAVVPLSDFVVFAGGTVAFCHLSNLVGSEAKVGAVFFAQHGIDGQIVHPSENALHGHPQNAGQEANDFLVVILGVSYSSMIIMGAMS